MSYTSVLGQRFYIKGVSSRAIALWQSTGKRDQVPFREESAPKRARPTVIEQTTLSLKIAEAGRRAFRDSPRTSPSPVTPTVEPGMPVVTTERAIHIVSKMIYEYIDESYDPTVEQPPVYTHQAAFYLNNNEKNSVFHVASYIRAIQDITMAEPHELLLALVYCSKFRKQTGYRFVGESWKLLFTSALLLAFLYTDDFVWTRSYLDLTRGGLPPNTILNLSRLVLKEIDYDLYVDPTKYRDVLVSIFGHLGIDTQVVRE